MARNSTPEAEVKSDGSVADAALLGASMADPSQVAGSLTSPFDGSQAGATLAEGKTVPSADLVPELFPAFVRDRIEHDGVLYEPGQVIELPEATFDRLLGLGVIEENF